MTVTATLELIEYATDLIEILTVKRIHKTQDPAITSLSTALVPIFKRQSRAVLKGLRRVRRHFSEAIEDEFDTAFDSAVLSTSSEMQTVITKTHEAQLKTAGSQIYRDFDVKKVFSLTNPRAVDYIRNAGAEAITHIDETTKADIRTIVLAGISNGTSYQKIAREISARYAQYTTPAPQQHIRNRAELIAITEVGNAYCAGNYIAAKDLKDLGLTMIKKWETVGDKRVSTGCKENAAAGWIDLDDDFPSGHTHPLRFPGCRCVALYDRKR